MLKHALNNKQRPRAKETASRRSASRCCVTRTFQFRQIRISSTVIYRSSRGPRLRTVLRFMSDAAYFIDLFKRCWDMASATPHPKATAALRAIARGHLKRAASLDPAAVARAAGAEFRRNRDLSSPAIPALLPKNPHRTNAYIRSMHSAPRRHIGSYPGEL